MLGFANGEAIAKENEETTTTIYHIVSYCIILYHIVILHDLNSMAASKGANRLPGRNIAGFLDSLDNIEGS